MALKGVNKVLCIGNAGVEGDRLVVDDRCTTGEDTVDVVYCKASVNHHMSRHHLCELLSLGAMAIGRYVQ